MAGKAVYYFLGIPYAQAPMADLRFEPPQKHPGWQVRNFRNIQVLQSKTYFFSEHILQEIRQTLITISKLRFSLIWQLFTNQTKYNEVKLRL